MRLTETKENKSAGSVSLVVDHIPRAAGMRLTETKENNSAGSVSLVVDHIPRALCNISSLNDYFSKFGVVVNVQVCLLYALHCSVAVITPSCFMCMTLLLLLLELSVVMVECWLQVVFTHCLWQA